MIGTQHDHQLNEARGILGQLPLEPKQWDDISNVVVSCDERGHCDLVVCRLLTSVITNGRHYCGGHPYLQSQMRNNFYLSFPFPSIFFIFLFCFYFPFSFLFFLFFYFSAWQCHHQHVAAYDWVAAGLWSMICDKHGQNVMNAGSMLPVVMNACWDDGHYSPLQHRHMCKAWCMMCM